ncbi:hypothetical protein BC332_06327 [Capsicum chinense]|nr:hypothetical protein BC332_06327 [Capsicum chinense]
MQNSKPVSTPLEAHFKLSITLSPKTNDEHDYMPQILYSSVVGSLVYAMVCSRPDLSYGLSAVSRYITNPGKEHWKIVQWIFRYLYGSANICLQFGWKATLQTTVALSTTEADCTSITEAFKESIWLKENIIESGGGKKHDYLQLDAVQNEVWKMLDGRKYLLVLDDVWNEDTLKWSRLKNMLIGGAKGSKILLTTCSDVVAEVSGSAHQHKLGDLLKEDTWTLFGKMAFECNKESKNSNLVEIGKEIVRKCGGIPLAIRSICSLLRQKRTEDECIYFKNQELSSITRGGNDVMTILRLSLNYLPWHLKICSTYCSLFPKDFLIQRSDLIDMWIARGFIQSTTSNRDDVEDVANSFFMDLFRRSFFQETEEYEFLFFQETERDSPHFYKMHNLIHDLAKEVV